MLITARSSTTTQRLHSFKFTLVNKSHSQHSEAAVRCLGRHFLILCACAHEVSFPDQRPRSLVWKREYTSERAWLASLVPRPSITANAVEGLVKLLRRMTSGRSFTRPSTALAVIEGLGMRLMAGTVSVFLPRHWARLMNTM